MVVTLIGLAVGCSKQDIDRTFEGPYFVRFTDSTLTYKESYSPVIPIRVNNVGPVLTQPITINYTVGGTARAGRDYQIQAEQAGVVVIPANKSFGTINLKLINNANNILESKTITLTLTGVQPSTLQVGLAPAGVLGKTLRFTLNTDCLFGGSYTGTGTVSGRGYTVQNVGVSSLDCKTYTLDNWNVGLADLLFGFNAVHPTLRFIDNGDNSITVPAQTNSELNTTDTLSGTGAWNPRNRVITLNLKLKLKLSATRDTTLSYTQTYTPQ